MRKKASFVAVALAVCAGGWTSSRTSAASPSLQSGQYGPLTFNEPGGADFYFAQNGEFARAEMKGGVIEIHLRNESFQIGHNWRQLNICLTRIPVEEISTDPRGNKASRLSGPFAGAREPNSDVLIVYDGREWSDGNTEFSEGTSMRAKPLAGYRLAYQVNRLDFEDDPKLNLTNFKGVLYGYIVVYKQPQRQNKDIMPIRLIFGQD